MTAPRDNRGMTMTRMIIAVLLAACDEPLDQRLAIISEPRILAITAEPAEGLPGQPVTHGVLIAGPDGTIATPPHWAYCLAGKPPTEDNAVSPLCLDDDKIIDLGISTTVSSNLPADGCTIFGPDVPSEGFRPRDPDASGGYYQPIRAVLGLPGGDLRGFGMSRIRCNLPNAPSDVAHDYQTNYAVNVTPSLVQLAMHIGDAPIDPDAVPVDADITLVAAWPASSAESYLYYDQRTQTLVTRRESLRVSWFATAGTLDVDASGVTEDEAATSVSTTWHTPSVAGPAHLWLVVRDSRGGLATQTVNVTLR